MENTEVEIYKQVKSISFSILSPTLIKKMASSKVVTPELYDKEGYPVDGGLMDVRLGVIDPGLKCKTCGQRLKECVGHFSYISLARPIIHVIFVKHILHLLRHTCGECSRILLDDKLISKYGDKLIKYGKERGIDAHKKKLKEIITAHKNVGKCPHCNAKQGKITLEKPTTFLEDEKRLSPIEIRTRFEKITDNDLRVLGYNPSSGRPEWLILTLLPIPPVTMRPSITLESGERSEDDLTHKLGDIVRINQRLFENINAGAPEIIIEDLWDLLQYHVTTFFDNDIAQLPPARHRSGQPLKTVSERIKSKEGRIRHNLTGKRTNFSARTVISPDPTLELNEVGVPRIMAEKLTVPEKLTEWNADYLKKFVERGPTKYPGANYIVRPDGKRKRLTSETIESSLEELQPGYIVERHVMDGDIALFNRQPSLHRMSMMAHKVKVLPGKTLRLNPAVCHPYNADFDGDEMNLHIPQTEEAKAEAELLMMVQQHLISPRYGLAIIGCVQDSVAGIYLLTQKDLEIPRHEAIDLLYSIGVDDFTGFSRKEMVPGKEIFSMLLPQDFNFRGKSRSKEEPEVVIESGRLLKGVLDKSNIGQESGLLIRNIHTRYGQDFTADFLGKIFRLGIAGVMRRGFTVAIDDADLPQEAKDQIDQIFESSDREVKKLIDDYYKGNLEILPGRSISETLEIRISELLSKSRNKAGEVVENYAKQNSHTIIMAKSGARGSTLNLAQIAGMVGQQSLRGKRIEHGYRDRTLSVFEKGDLGTDARGFVRSNFKGGLKPHEFFFQAMVGRDSLMDTALRTPKSGYLYRRLANGLQDVKVEHDYTIRDAGNRIIQFRYGDDSIDVSKSEGGKINVRRIIDEEMNSHGQS